MGDKKGSTTGADEVTIKIIVKKVICGKEEDDRDVRL
jgi:hypothetical protein